MAFGTSIFAGFSRVHPYDTSFSGTGGEFDLGQREPFPYVSGCCQSAAGGLGAMDLNKLFYRLSLAWLAIAVAGLIYVLLA
ncbi:hypothetical protein [Bradyrhizobium jicamae]|uniref:hypothetical protein n=1 Tax=Bradyrhizobium jicamae TaxID=280332 RepID=UPI001BA74017|nr:hypothetical protein [Bradyrhizobium jicamae]MBR0939036.1 hypothetical protein [Bradyrhizobium jicamae]